MLELVDIHKSYEGKPLLEGISFTVSANETVCLLGASGSGKSTLLRIIAGLESTEQGTVCWDGQDLASVPPHLRNFGMVFQDYALFPHLTVEENVGFGLKMQNLPKAEREQRVNHLLEQVHLGTFAFRRVTELSGGEQQRVALARALAPSPRLLMFDEPLGALDRALKDSMLDELRQTLQKASIPAVYVTHDQEEACAIADRILLLHDGRIIQDGTPVEVWRQPASAWAARFLALGNVIEGVTLAGGDVTTAAGVLHAACRHAHPVGSKVSLLIRPEAASSGRGENMLHSRVSEVFFQHDHFRTTLENGFTFHLPVAHPLGEAITIRFPVSAVECLA